MDRRDTWIIETIQKNEITDERLNARAGKENCTILWCTTGIDKKLVIHADTSFQQLAGYSPSHFEEGGIDTWFGLIHPDDARTVSEKIIQAFAFKNFSPPEWITFNYRLKTQTGLWLDVQEEKYCVVVDGTQHSVSFLANITGQKVCGEDELNSKLAQMDLGQFPLLDKALKRRTDYPGESDLLSRREREVLTLISEGFSTKLIADKLSISIHTVETHRSHLLKKLNVRNSAELIRQASKASWL